MLRLIEENRGVVARVLAAEMGLPTLDFKARIRKLKALGLCAQERPRTCPGTMNCFTPRARRSVLGAGMWSASHSAGAASGKEGAAVARRSSSFGFALAALLLAESGSVRAAEAS